MKTKSLFSTALLLGALAFTSISFTGCSKESSTVEPTNSDELLVSTLPDPAMENSQVDGCTEAEDLSLTPPQSDKRRAPFGPILRKLNLTDDQKTQIKELLKSHEECALAATADLRAAEKEIAQRARAARKDVLDSAKAGVITRDSAHHKLDEIRRGAMEALAGLQDQRAAAADALKICRDQFFASIGTILTEEQLAMLNDWLTNEAPKDPRGRRPEPPRHSRPKP